MFTYSLVHRTVHTYPALACRSRNELRLQPRHDSAQRLVQFQLDVSPSAEIQLEKDYFGNDVWLVSVEADHEELVIASASLVDLERGSTVTLSRPWNARDINRSSVREFCLPSPRVPKLDATNDLIGELGLQPGSVEDLLHLNRCLPGEMTYIQGVTQVNTPLAEVLERRWGVCQDFAHVMLALARELGWPARYVSGYLAPEKGASTGESHAWVEIASPDGGWLGLDPTHGAPVGEHHIAVAVGRDYDDAAPLKGTFVSSRPGGPPQVEVSVQRLGEQ